MKKVILISIVFFFTGCSGYRPIVDMQGRSQGQYERDLYACQQYAEQVSPATSAAIGTGAGAAIGAGFGAILGAFLGCAGDGAAMGAALGGASGLTAGAGDGMRAQVNIIRRCMQGRGWNVLN